MSNDNQCFNCPLCGGVVQCVPKDQDEKKSADASKLISANNGYLTSNFHLSEFHCKDGTEVPKEYEGNALQVALVLQTLRDFLGGYPIKVRSGYRTKEHNKRVGGAPHSQHLTASASDIEVEGHSTSEVFDALNFLQEKGKIPLGGLKEYRSKGFVHVDIRGYKARW